MRPLPELSGIITPTAPVFECHQAGIPPIDPDRHWLAVHGLMRRPNWPVAADAAAAGATPQASIEILSVSQLQAQFTFIREIAMSATLLDVQPVAGRIGAEVRNVRLQAADNLRLAAGAEQLAVTP